MLHGEHLSLVAEGFDLFTEFGIKDVSETGKVLSVKYAASSPQGWRRF